MSGDFTVRCAHLDGNMREHRMFRFSAHTSFIPNLERGLDGRVIGGGFLRLYRRDLDAACKDPRFDHHFFVDCFFGPPDGHGAGLPSPARPL